MPIPTKRVELDRIGRKKNGHLRVGLEPLPDLDNAIAIRDTVARLISNVYEGKLHPRIAAALAPLMHLQMRVVEKTGLKRPCQTGSFQSSWTRISRL
jgi:hypothetical protein